MGRGVGAVPRTKKKAVSNRACVNNTRGKTKLPGKKEEPNATHTQHAH